MQDPFFDTLRTKQKTGYIAQSDTLEIQNYRFQRFLVQSSSHQSEDLLSRFELFCETMVQDLPELVSEERFSTLKQGIADSLQKYERGLDEKSELLDTLAFEKEADFNWVQKRLQGFSDLTYEGFLDQADQLLSRNNHKRLAILMDGKVQEPFTYKTISRSEFSGEYLSRPQVAQNE